MTNELQLEINPDYYNMTSDEILRAEITNYMDKHDITFRKFGAISGISPQTLSCYGTKQRHKRKPSFKMLYKLFNFMYCTGECDNTEAMSKLVILISTKSDVEFSQSAETNI